MTTLSATTAAHRSHAPPLEGRAATRAVLALVAGQFMANLDTAVTNVAAPAIHVDLGATGSQLQLVTSGFVMSYAVLLITGARLGTLHGFRTMYLSGLAAFTVCSLLCGVAPDPLTLIVARICQGAAAAVMVPQVLTGIQRLVGGEGRARAFGWYAAALSAGAVAGQVLGGVLVTADLAGLGWRTVFLVNVPVGVALLFLTARVVPVSANQKQPHESLDLAGVVLLSVSVLLVVVPLVLGRELGWPTWGWVALAASVVSLGCFVHVERRISATGGHPLVDPHLLGRP
ncbi:MAG TPA: MFS transporter, partial [Nocardioides sp.]|nr:MFS transporter [Nocardioides sp.]